MRSNMFTSGITSHWQILLGNLETESSFIKINNKGDEAKILPVVMVMESRNEKFRQSLSITPVLVTHKYTLGYHTDSLLLILLPMYFCYFQCRFDQTAVHCATGVNPFLIIGNDTGFSTVKQVWYSQVNLWIITCNKLVSV